MISVHIGQAGLQIGESLWKTLKRDGLYNYSPLCYETCEGSINGRCVFFDDDPFTISRAKSEIGDIVGCSSFITSPENSGGICFRSTSSANHSSIDEMVERMRKMAETCDNLDSILFNYSINGGCSGVIRGVFERFENDFKKVCKVAFSVFPSEKFSTSVCEPFNGVEGIGNIVEHLDNCFMMENESLYQCYENRMKCEKTEDVGYKQINDVISRSIATVLNFPSNTKHDKQERLFSRMNSFFSFGNRCKFLTLSATSSSKSYDSLDRKSQLDHMIKDIYNPSNWFSYSNSNNGKLGTSHICSWISLKGGFSLSDANYCSSAIHSDMSHYYLGSMIDPIHTEYNPLAAKSIDSERNMALISHTTDPIHRISNLKKKFEALYRRKSFVFWYYDGLEILECSENLLASVIDDYKDISKEITLQEDEVF